MQAIEPGLRQRLPKALAVVFGLGALLIAPTIMPKSPPQYTWNFTNSVPLGVYKRLGESDAKLGKLASADVYVTFCLPQELQSASFFERFCSPSAPSKKRIIKRLVAEQTTGGLVVQGDTETSLDSRVLGPIEIDQVDAFWRPFLTWSLGQ
ncbi:hypothetical protein WG622_17220 [Cognatishimia sp. D5M38]|uniref:Uncharacterized protein n=1 Tax=Cognatishimia coralii TaxID=3083254 RepID=A0ABU8QKQ8_9RHOB|nr:hypothetical protein [Donghicola eburneus]MCI5040743.1 hypothetical protein [Donghicola eburneus]